MNPGLVLGLSLIVGIMAIGEIGSAIIASRDETPEREDDPSIPSAMDDWDAELARSTSALRSSTEPPQKPRSE